MGTRWLQLGFEYIDDQHRELFRLIDKMKESLHTNTSDRERAVRESLRFLEDYVHFHFLNEEKLMLEYHYDSERYQAHTKEHKEFIATFGRLKQEFHGDSLYSPEKLLNKVSHEVEQWTIDHIQKTDQLMVNFLKKQGAK